MKRTPEELDALAADTERWLDELDPETVAVSDPAELRAVAAASESARLADEELLHAVERARHADQTWGAIAMVLGVSRQAVWQRFGKRVRVPAQR